MPRSLNSVRPNLVKYWFAGEQKKISGIARLVDSTMLAILVSIRRSRTIDLGISSIG